MHNRLQTKTVFLAVLFLGLFSMAARNATDPDLWWHLATGQYIVQRHAVPHTDPFSCTRTGKPWIAHEWLTDVLIYELHRTTGWAGLIFIFAAVIAAAFFLLYLRCGSDAYVAGVAVLCAALATRPVWGVRPQVLSFLLTSLWLLILERSGRNPKILWWTLPLMLLWVNLHAGFALGLALLALFLAGDLIEPDSIKADSIKAWVEPEIGKPQTPSRLRFLAFILALNLLLVPLNPNGTKLFWYPIATLRSAAMQNYIAEWASPNFHHPEYWPFLLIVLALFAMGAWQPHILRRRDVLLLVVSLFAALRSIRLIPLFALIAVPLISRQIEKWKLKKSLLARPASAQSRRHLPLVALNLLNGLFILGMAAFASLHTAQVIQDQPISEIQHFPERAIAFLSTHPPAGPLFNSYDWGGYLIWKLYPSVRVFIDGRADVYGDQLFGEFADTYGFKDDWQHTFEQWHIQTVLVPRDAALATGLRRTRSWIITYEDDQAVILTRSLGRAPNSATQSGLPFPALTRWAMAPWCTAVTLDMQEITPAQPFGRVLLR